MNSIRNYQKELDSIIGGIVSGSSMTKGQNPPRLLLHSCCAPCSSYVLEYLRRFFRIAVFYYNPNISMETEYVKRVEEQKRLIAEYNESLQRETEAEVWQNAQRESEAEVWQDAQRESEAEVRQDAQRESEVGMRQDMLDGAGGELHIEQDARFHGLYPIEIIEGDYEPDKFFEVVKGLEGCPEGGERCFKCYEMRLRKASQIAVNGNFDYFTTTLTISPLKNAPKLNEIGERLAKECGIKWLPSDFKKKGGYQRSIELSKEYGLYRQDYCGCVYSKIERERKAEVNKD